MTITTTGSLLFAEKEASCDEAGMAVGRGFGGAKAGWVMNQLLKLCRHGELSLGILEPLSNPMKCRTLPRPA
eukprot:1159641-Pelagomonas_calceolata.AAC.1